MRKTFILLVFLISSFYVFSQVTFQKTYGGGHIERVNSVQRTSDGGYITVGYTNSFGAGSYDVYLIKTDMYGDIIWTKSYGESGWDIGKFVQQTSDGGYILGGETRSFSGNGNKQIYLIKTDAAGSLIWSKTFGGTYLGSVFQTQDGGYIISGQNFDALVIKTDGNGNIMWTKTFVGGSSAMCAKQTSTGEYFIVGYSSWFNPSICDGVNVMMLKLDAGGNLLWQKKVTCGWGQSFFQTPDGGFMILGNVGAILPQATHLMKTDSAGSLIWAKSYASVQAHAFVQTDDYGYLIAGSFGPFGALCAFKTDSVGNVFWSNVYGGPGDSVYSVDRASDDGYIMAGKKYSMTDSSEAYLINTNDFGYSGCSQNNIPINDTVLSLQVTVDSLSESSNNTASTVVTNVGLGGVSDTICFAIGIQELNQQADEVFLFPNPATSELRIKNLELKIDKVEIYDTIGQRVFSKQPTASNQQLTIDVSSLQNGIYFLHLKNNSKIRTQKFIISR